MNSAMHLVSNRQSGPSGGNLSLVAWKGFKSLRFRSRYYSLLLQTSTSVTANLEAASEGVMSILRLAAAVASAVSVTKLEEAILWISSKGFLNPALSSKYNLCILICTRTQNLRSFCTFRLCSFLSNEREKFPRINSTSSRCAKKWEFLGGVKGE